MRVAQGAMLAVGVSVVLIQCRAEDQKHKVSGISGVAELDAAAISGGASFTFDGRTILTRSALLEIIKEQGDEINDGASASDNQFGGRLKSPSSNSDDKFSAGILAKARVKGQGERVNFSIKLNDEDMAALGGASALPGLKVTGHTSLDSDAGCHGADFSSIDGIGVEILDKASEILSACTLTSNRLESRDRVVTQFNLEMNVGRGAIKLSTLSRMFKGSNDGEPCKYNVAQAMASVEGACISYIEDITHGSGAGLKASAQANLQLGDSALGFRAHVPTPNLHQILTLASGDGSQVPTEDESVLIKIDRSTTTRTIGAGEMGRYIGGKMPVRINNWEGTVDFAEMNSRRQPSYKFTRTDGPAETVVGFIETKYDPKPVPVPVPTPTPTTIPTASGICESVLSSSFPSGSSALPAGSTAGYVSLMNPLTSVCTASSGTSMCRQFKSIDSALFASIKSEYGVPNKKSGAAYFEVYVLRSCSAQASTVGLSPTPVSGLGVLSMGIESSGKLIGQGVSAAVFPKSKAGDVIQVLADFDNKRLYLGHNNEWVYFPQAGTPSVASVFDQAKFTAGLMVTKGDGTAIDYAPFITLGAGWEVLVNMGQQAFRYSVPDLAAVLPSTTAPVVLKGWY